MARLFPAVVGIASLCLTLWCVAVPGQTSGAAGFNLQPGSGESEFLVVYGGLEFGPGLIFLWPLYRQHETRFSL